MAYDEGVAQRVREIMAGISVVTEKKMFGGIAFMVNGNMCVGIVKEQLMLRVGPDQYEALLNKNFVLKMDFTGKPMRGFIYIQPEGFTEDKELQQWIDIALSFVNTLPPK